MTELQNDPAILKLIDYAKNKRRISYEEVHEFLPDSIVNSDKIEDVIAILAKHAVTLEEDDLKIDESGDQRKKEPKPDGKKKRIVIGDKESAIDDPIRLYLREIGKENLLTAEQEVELSKKMEDGENILKDVIKRSGILIPEFYNLAQRAFSKRDPREMDLTKKEISEFLAERRRLGQYYREALREIIGDLQVYMDLKEKALSRGGDILEDSSLTRKRKTLMKGLQVIEMHQEEIVFFSEKFASADRRIRRLREEHSRIDKRLRVKNMRELRNLGRSSRRKTGYYW